MDKTSYFTNIMKNKIDDNVSEIEKALNELKDDETMVFKVELSVEKDKKTLVPSGGFIFKKKTITAKDPIDADVYNDEQPDMFKDKKE